MSSDQKMPDTYFPDIEFIRALEVKGTVLEGIQLADLAAYISSAAKLRIFCLKPHDNLRLSGVLDAEASKLPELDHYAKEILKELNPDGSVRDNHPLLKNARAKIAALHGKIAKASNSFFNEDKSIWQTTVASQRDGRIVLPLKSNYRSRVKGIINEVSSSGATVFIEPFEIVELNNEMALEQNQLKLQVFKIYKNLTEKVRESAEALKDLQSCLSFIDSWYARAVYSIRNRCVRPEKSVRSIIIKNGRHPLLGANAVPITLSYNSSINLLIITGPNAGGKTVTLKTCGLFVLMNQFACEIPADEGTALGLYENIFADIGDDQSIEQSLSTFSGHMRRISSIIKSADERSLVLLDELGSGTDPSQGSAIAMGVLNFLLENSISTIITSHHSAVKNFGYTNKGAVNASVAFDSETMKPTYRIIEGVPGESHAVEIAESMGLPEKIITLSKKYLENDNTTVSGMIKELERRQMQIIENEKIIDETRKTLREDRRILDLKNLKLKQLQHELDLKDYSRLKGFVEETRKDLENLVRELREGEITREKNLKVKNKIKELDDKLKEEKEKLSETELSISENQLEYNSGKAAEFKAGDEVLYIKNQKKGFLIEERKKNTWIVAFGNIKLPINKKELKSVRQKKNLTISRNTSSFKSNACFELDLRGMRVYEAQEALLKQLDAAILSGLSEFSIIHGLGDGILQKAVQDFLRDCDSVKEFSFSDPEQGGFGKTIVRLE